MDKLRRIATGFNRPTPWLVLAFGLAQFVLWWVIGAPEFPILGVLLVAVALRIAWRSG